MLCCLNCRAVGKTRIFNCKELDNIAEMLVHSVPGFAISMICPNLGEMAKKSCNDVASTAADHLFLATRGRGKGIN